MYQYALPWFSALFCKSIGQAPPAPDLEGRLQSLNDCFTRAVYVNVCRSLFEAHKLLFSFLLAIKILQVHFEHLGFFSVGVTRPLRSLSGGRLTGIPDNLQSSEYLPLFPFPPSLLLQNTGMGYLCCPFQ